MRTPFYSTSGVAALALLLCAPPTQAHTWIQSLQLIGSNGAFSGPLGYMRGFHDRGPGFVEEDLVNRNTAIDDKTPMCKALQKGGKQTPGFDTLKAAPSDWVALQYLDNGHVTKNTGPRPAGNGTVYVYGTKNAADSDTLLGIHKKWNEAGDGGDKRGKLLATRYYDDGQCHETSDQPLSVARAAKDGIKEAGLPCQTDIQIPEDAGTDGLYTVYWVWDYALMNPEKGVVQTNETYTTCMDINLKSEKTSKALNFQAAQGSGVKSMAIEQQLKTAFIADPTAPLVMQDKATPYVPKDGPKKTSSAPSAPSSTPAPSSASQSPPKPSSVAPSVAPSSSAPAPSSATQSAPKQSSTPDPVKTVTVTATPVPTTVYVTGAAPTDKPNTTIPAQGQSSKAGSSSGKSLAPNQRPGPSTAPASSSSSAPNTMQTSEASASQQPTAGTGGVFATQSRGSSAPSASPSASASASGVSSAAGPLKVTGFLTKRAAPTPKFIRAARAYLE